MALAALSWCGLVEDHPLSIDLAAQLVTIVTSYVSMRALERKGRSLVMIELRRFPPLRVVTAGTIGGIFARGKLPAVRIVVTPRALC